MELGSIGVWSGALRTGERTAVLDAAAELEDLGYGTIWFPAREHEHHAAGADHVCIQVLTQPAGDLSAAMLGWRALANVLANR